MNYRDLEANKRVKKAGEVKAKIFTDLRRNKALNNGERLIAMEIFDQDIDRDAILWRTPNMLAKELKMDPGHVLSILQSLEKIKFIRRARIETINGKLSKAKAIILNANMIMESVGEERWKECPYEAR